MAPDPWASTTPATEHCVVGIPGGAQCRDRSPRGGRVLKQLRGTGGAPRPAGWMCSR